MQKKHPAKGGGERDGLHLKYARRDLLFHMHSPDIPRVSAASRSPSCPRPEECSSFFSSTRRKRRRLEGRSSHRGRSLPLTEPSLVITANATKLLKKDLGIFLPTIPTLRPATHHMDRHATTQQTLAVPRLPLLRLPFLLSFPFLFVLLTMTDAKSFFFTCFASLLPLYPATQTTSSLARKLSIQSRRLEKPPSQTQHPPSFPPLHLLQPVPVCAFSSACPSDLHVRTNPHTYLPP